MAEQTLITIEDIRTQCVVVTKAVIELRKSQQKYYRCYRDNPRKGEFLAESKMNEHMVDAELVKYQYLCECFKNQNIQPDGQGQEQTHETDVNQMNVVTDPSQEELQVNQEQKEGDLPF